MPSPHQPLAIVTGASGGIGLEIARLLAGDGYDLVIVAQDAEKLGRAARELKNDRGVRVSEFAADLSEPASPQTLAHEIDREGLVPDVLVNNAGYGLRGAFAEIGLAQQLRLIDVNVRALTHLTGLFLPGMLQRKRGRVLNVASTAAFQPGPLMAVYYASKAYVLSLSEALANETAGSGVTVTALCPGPTATGFQERAGMRGTRLFEAGVMTAAEVARQGYDGMKRGDLVVIPGWRNRLLAKTVQLLPRPMVLNAVRSMQEAPKK
jgi:short-subunit dehydrogenase